MGAVTLPTTGTVYVDAQIVIYTVEQHPKWAAPLVPFWAAVTSGGVQVLTSELTILEALVVPFRSGDQQIIGAYDRFFRRPELAWIPVSRAVLRAAAELRSVVPRLKTPDAIHVASARAATTPVFLTNDAALQQLPGVTTVLLSHVAP